MVNHLFWETLHQLLVCVSRCTSRGLRFARLGRKDAVSGKKVRVEGSVALKEKSSPTMYTMGVSKLVDMLPKRAREM